MGNYDYPARALRALGLLYVVTVNWQEVPPEWGGGSFLAALAVFFFYEKDRNPETESRKIDPKVQNGPSLPGLQTGR